MLAALGNGNLRIAMHVRSLTAGASDGVLSVPTPPVSNVPLPAAGLLLASALFGGSGPARPPQHLKRPPQPWMRAGLNRETQRAGNVPAVCTSALWRLRRRE